MVPCVVFSVMTTKLPAEGQTLTLPGGAGSGCPGQWIAASRTAWYGDGSSSEAAGPGSGDFLLNADL